MLSRKGQGTTEYLIILAVIIVIALVVVGVMGWFPGLGTGITEQQSNAYWQSTSPLAITDWEIDGTNADLVLRNMTTEKVTITAATLDGTAVGGTDANIAAGGTTTFTGTGVTCTSGAIYDYDVVLTYDTPYLVGKTQTGTKPMIGICP